MADRHRDQGNGLSKPNILLREIKLYSGYVGRWRLLSTEELPMNGTEGFRLFWRGLANEWIDVSRDDNGTIHVSCTVSDWGGLRFDEKIETPRPHLVECVDLGLEYILLN